MKHSHLGNNESLHSHAGYDFCRGRCFPPNCITTISLFVDLDLSFLDQTFETHFENGESYRIHVRYDFIEVDIRHRVASSLYTTTFTKFSTSKILNVDISDIVTASAIMCIVFYRVLYLSSNGTIAAVVRH